MIHDIRWREQELCMLIIWHVVDVNLWHCLIKTKDFKIKEGCAIDLDVDKKNCSEILFSCYFQYKSIMKSSNSNPPLVNMHRSDLIDENYDYSMLFCVYLSALQ